MKIIFFLIWCQYFSSKPCHNFGFYDFWRRLFLIIFTKTALCNQKTKSHDRFDKLTI